MAGWEWQVVMRTMGASDANLWFQRESEGSGEACGMEDSEEHHTENDLGRLSRHRSTSTSGEDQGFRLGTW